mgnify:CR=1 FL=1
MRNRDYKQWAEGEYYHVYNRGNAKQNIFLDNQDYNFFLFRLKQNLFPKDEYKFRTPPLPENSFSLISYCLMPNHFHFLIKQNKTIPVTKLITRICTSYSMYFNKKYEKVGHVFQDRFKQVPIEDNKQLLWLTSYIHHNPAVAGLVKHPSGYQWSSYREFINSTNGGICEKNVILEQFKNKNEFQIFTEESLQTIKTKKDLGHLLLDT